ncbi:LacI family DNA-binding transcriptional regulator [Vallitalea guaymasensis]|uniref:LacI family DNA-binding transcriptional regulator n=2 Tax=Vallitalea guaymasensis TaxID=1185412 RepID=UPI000DE31989|nr:LacI family DNA-binding transcriptional regulator [Vallitalea guaymasensis]
MAITSEQIAKLANVSRGTVDRALHNRGGVSPEVSARIKKIAAELGYTPNTAASALARTKKRTTVGIIIPANQNYFFDNMKSGLLLAQEEFSNYGIQLEIFQTYGFDEYNQLKYIEELEKKGMNGLLISPVNTEKIKNKIIQLTENKIPVITLNSDIEKSKRLCYVGHDYYQSGKTAEGMMALINNRKFKLAIITGSTKSLSQSQRVEGFINNAKKRSHDFDIVEICENNDDDIDSYLQTLRILKEYKDLNALYITGSGIYGVVKALKELKLERKICVITFGDLPRTLEYVIEDTIDATICQNVFDQGYVSAKLMFNYIIKNEYPNKDKYYTKIDIRIKENILPNY